MSLECDNCGAPLESEELFCSECGQKVNKVAAGVEEESTSRIECAVSENVETVSDLEHKTSRDTWNQSESNENIFQSQGGLGFKKTTVLPIGEVDPTPSEIRRAATMEKAEFHSDCPHFDLEWNQGASVFLVDIMSTLQFRLSPKCDEAVHATDYKFSLLFPGEENFKDFDPRIHQLRNPRTTYINYRPNTISAGINLAVVMIFSYQLNGETFCYDTNLLVDIYPQDEKADKVLENLTIKIGDIKQEGNASDHQLDILKNLDLANSRGSVSDLLDKLKNAELWLNLEMYMQQTGTGSGTAINKPPPPPRSYSRLSLKCKNGLVIHLFNNHITGGRSRQADMILRKEPLDGESWNHEKLKLMNLKISGIHCSLGIDSDGAWVSDMDSTNGTFLDGNRILNNKSYLDKQKEYQLSLACPTEKPYNLLLFLRVYKCSESRIKDSKQDNTAGVVIKRPGRDYDVSMLIKQWVPLSSVLADSGNYFITFHSGNFALTDGNNWFWLSPETSFLPSDCGIFQVVV